ncbi:MAG: DUF2510 domain-containing protein [Rhodoglobus sp.]
MSLIQHAHVPAGWYPDGVADDSLRWWDGTDWTNDVRSVAAPILVAVPPMDVEYVPAESLAIEPTPVITPETVFDLLTPVPERQASDQHADTQVLSRRQLREMLGGPLVTETPINL